MPGILVTNFDGLHVTMYATVSMRVAASCTDVCSTFIVSTIKGNVKVND